VTLTAAAAGDAEVDLAVHHLAAEARADAVAAQLRAVLPRIAHLHVAEIGPVLGAHLGPGTIGTVLVRR
jgi:fatty acid-binding protein DegV